MKKNNRIGVVLGGGGARGFVHLGVLKALEEKGIVPDIISSVSAGSIVGVLIASGLKPDEIFELMKEYKFTDYAKVGIPVDGLFTLHNLQESLSKILSCSDFSDLKIPLYVAITNLYSGKVEYVSSGAIIPIILASCSIPVIFSPVEINGQLYVDGGVLDNLPVKPLININCETIIAVNINPIGTLEKVDSLYEVAARTFQLSVSRINEETKKECDIFIEPHGIEQYHLFDTRHADELFEAGYSACKDIDWASFG